MDREGHQVSHPSTVSITTLGCKANQYDSAAMEELFTERGFRTVPFPGLADAYIINTCTVTSRTDSQSRQVIRRARRINPRALVIVTGCYAQVSPDEVKGLAGVDYVLGNPEKEEILRYIERGRNLDGPVVATTPPEGGLGPRAFSAGGRTRASIKVQDGCGRRCTYCIIPAARGRSRSLGLEAAEREIERIIEKGFREIVLTGIHLGAWGRDFRPSLDLTDLLELIEKKDWPARFRLSSLDPDEVKGPLIEILSMSEKICNHLHIALQSGDDGVLARMKRPYRASHFIERTQRVAARVKEISIGTDVIAGFPGEDERAFANTLSVLKDSPVSYLHVFPFSARKGTPAATMDGSVPPSVIKERCRRLRALDGKKRKDFLSRFIGSEALVLPEKRGGAVRGKTSNYIDVHVEGPGGGGKEGFRRVVLTGLDGEKAMKGRFID